MVAGPAADVGTAVSARRYVRSGASPAPRPRRRRALVAGALAVLLPVALAVGTWGLLRWQEARSDLEARAEATAVAEAFVLQYFTYDAAGVEDYADAIGAMLTTSARSAYDRDREAMTTLMEEIEQESSGSVHAAGVATLDDDAARVLVVVDSTSTSTLGEAQQALVVEVPLARVDGEWLVDGALEPVS